MADDKKNIPEAAPPAEDTVPTAERAAVPEQSAPVKNDHASAVEVKKKMTFSRRFR